MEPLIRADRVTRRYLMGESVVTALEGLDLEIDAGDRVAVLGRSGSGKSTLLHLLGGLDRPTSGDIRVGGRALAELSNDDLARYRRESVGFIFQFFNLVPSMTAEQNVELPMTLAGASRSERRRRAGELLDRVGLSGRRGHRPSELSGGEQQRVSIARALVHDPALLLADEPTGNLDSRTAAEVLDVIRGLEGKTVVLVTHDRALASDFARRTIELQDGRKVSDERR
ncbi:MAG TPA: ABC transporter ATP-binding protein [Planctomycetota bacterium]|nr:ABC transporter ATP-binding protein [Planctomycetota bacterium]